jgi:hypothetical protein
MMAEPQPIVQVLLATMNRQRPPDVLGRFGPNDERPEVLVVNQCTEIEPPDELREPGLRMVSVKEHGLSRSRNLALAEAVGDLLVLSDDDLSYDPALADIVRRGFARFPRAAVVTFQFRNSGTGRLAKAYRGSARLHNALSVGGVSSIEMALRRDRLGGLRFDERFGVGGGIPTGEEAIFLADVLRAGQEVAYWPEPLCEHPGMGSGHSEWRELDARRKGAVLRRMYPIGWPAVVLGFTVAKYPKYHERVGLLRWLIASFDGAAKLDPKNQKRGTT